MLTGFLTRRLLPSYAVGSRSKLHPNEVSRKRKRRSAGCKQNFQANFTATRQSFDVLMLVREPIIGPLPVRSHPGTGHSSCAERLKQLAATVLYKRSDTGERDNAVGISARYLESLENNVQHRLRFKRFCHVDAVAVATEGIRTFLVLTGRVAANGFTPENEGLTPFMQRLARANANRGRPA
jgi:hypothetical protein